MDGKQAHLLYKSPVACMQVNIRHLLPCNNHYTMLAMLQILHLNCFLRYKDKIQPLNLVDPSMSITTELKE